MRLICPNCGAQYAVADDVIPAGGRDVQCSNCAHTWFETPGASANDGAAAETRTAQPTPPPAPEEDLSPAPQPPKERRPVKPEVADILREEAALETAQRRSEAPEPIESQSDLGLDDPEPAPKPAEPPVKPKTAEQTVHEKAAALSAAAAGAAAAGSRRELLPDIEEINSNLSKDDESESAAGSNGALFAQTETERQGRGFRRGFFLSLLIIAFLVMVYVQADAIKSALPALTGVMDSYVGFVDGLRISLDSTVRGLLGQSGDAG